LDALKRINEISGIAESDTGLSHPSTWDLASDRRVIREDHLQVARCLKIINDDTDEPRYIINIKQYAKFVVELADTLAPGDIEEGMRCAVERQRYRIQIPLPTKIDSQVTAMEIDERPDVTYSDIGGCREEIEKMREVLEMPLLNVSRSIKLHNAQLTRIIAA